ncbi:MAG: hypothetical protein EOO51_15325, partial [Flavobacterium sp.]
GAENVAFGPNSLKANSVGNFNTAVGSYALSGNLTSGSVAVGWYALGFNTSGQYNTATGFNALRANTTGSYNTANGYSALINNTGSHNSAFGVTSLTTNTTGDGNTGLGFNTLYSNTIGSGNTAAGSSSLWENINGSENSAFGELGLHSNTSGSYNTAVGESAIYSSVSGLDNTGIGADSMWSLTSGSNNTAIGSNAMYWQTAGTNNIAIGKSAALPTLTGSNQLSIGNVIYGIGMDVPASAKIGIGQTAPNARLDIPASNTAAPANTDGVLIPRVSALTATGSMTAAQNGMQVFLTTAVGTNQPGFYYWDAISGGWLAVGAKSGWGLTGNAGTSATTNFIGTTDNVDVAFKRFGSKAGLIGTTNSAFGLNTFNSISSGSQNSAMGTNALRDNTTGSNNTAMGGSALLTNLGGSFNTGIGYNAYPINTALNNYTALGYNTGSVSSASNMIDLGNSSITTIRAQVTGITAYSDRRIKNNIKSNVPGLEFITLLNPVTYNLDIHKQNQMLYKGKSDTPDWDGKYDIEKIVQTGFIAQEVAEAAKAANYDFNGVDIPKTEDGLYSVNYTTFVVPLVKAVQQQQQMIESGKAENEKLLQEIAKLKSDQQTLEQRLAAIEKLLAH